MIIVYEHISVFSREVVPKSLYVGDERCGQRRVCPTTLFIFRSDCKQRVKKALFAVGAESIRAGFLYRGAMVLFPCCVQRCLNIKFISAMHLMFIACCKGFNTLFEACSWKPACI